MLIHTVYVIHKMLSPTPALLSYFLKPAPYIIITRLPVLSCWKAEMAPTLSIIWHEVVLWYIYEWKQANNLQYTILANDLSNISLKMNYIHRKMIALAVDQVQWNVCKCIMKFKELWKRASNLLLSCTLVRETTDEPPHDKTNKMTCAPSEDSDQPGHPPSLIRVFAVCTKKAGVLSYLLSAQRRLWSNWASAEADLNLRWAQSDFVGFVMRRLRL